MSLITDPNLNNSDPSTAAFMTTLRDGVKLAGVLLTTNGAATDSQVQLYSGIAVAVGGFLWSLYVSWQKSHKINVATTAVKQQAGGDEVIATAALNRAQLALSRKV